MIRAEHITVRIGTKTIVEDVSFAVEEGQWLMLTGPNGAGKSTLIRALTRGVPYAGTVTLDGADVRRMKPHHLARRVGVLAQHNASGYAYTVEQVVALGRYAHAPGFLSGRDGDAQAHIDRALALTGMTAMRGASVLTLSGGELQRAFLAQVFAQDPQLLILDEPANHLDLPYQKHIFEVIDQWRQSPGRAVISVVHDLTLARRFGTHALLMQGGRCAARGAIGEVLTAENLGRVYGMDVCGWLRELAAGWERA